MYKHAVASNALFVQVDEIKKIENVFGNLSRISFCLQHKTTILYDLACLPNLLAQEQPGNKLDS